MTMSAVEDEARQRRARYPGLLALALGCYVLAVITGLFLLADDFSPVVLVPLWIVHAVLLVVLLRKLGARESSTYAMLFIVAASVMSVYIADMARDGLTLQRRGERITATVVREWRDPAQGRKARDYHYELERQDGTKVPGPALRESSDRYDVGQTVTVIADPEGVLRPRTPGEADATGDALGAAGFALAALGSVGWMTWRGSDAARRRTPQKRAGAWRKAYKTVTRDRSTAQEQEAKLREVLRSAPTDRRGYIKVQPEEFPDLTHGEAARIAWEAGLKAEAVGNRGSWRFGERVVEEVPHD
ncbi:hypothetical protein ACIPSE_04960 [Streptomyces sp. NPDC090106]|uniref:hypothetical protein n=1 Tax=Streptomyces sp. NPDC090106 TaxID=3365946 RepID=UPI0037F99335